MKKIVLTYGFISGAIAALLMVSTIPFADRIGLGHSYYLGYTTIVASMLLVYFGVRSYRESVGHGQITFGRACAVGLLIMLISCVCYVVTWEILYFRFLPGFMDKYGAYALEKARAAGASPAALQAQTEKMNKLKVMYNNPFFNAALTFLEPLPVGIVVALVSAATLRRKAASPADPLPVSS